MKPSTDTSAWRAFLGHLPAGLADDAPIPVPAGVLRELLAGGGDAEQVAPVPAVEPTWRERLWTAPGETRIGVAELAEALGCSRDWIYARTSPKRSREAQRRGAGAARRIPHRKLDGLVFVVGEIRTWITESEEVVVQGRADAMRPALRIARGGSC
ncbi:MAG: hypothetical protein AB1941_10110 [Gemmatimonadota bacterium]